MKARVWTTLQARVQTSQARRWWRKNRPAARGLFSDELAKALALLSDAPEIGQPYWHPVVLGLRRYLLPRTRYHIYYVPDRLGGSVTILAVWSAVRGRAPKLRLL